MLRKHITVLYEPDVNQSGGGASASTESAGKGASTPSLADIVNQTAAASQAAGPDGLQGGGRHPEGVVGDEGGDADDTQHAERELAEQVKTGEELPGDVQELDTTQGKDTLAERSEVPPGPLDKGADDKGTQQPEVPREFAKHPAWRRIMEERDAERAWKAENQPLVEAQNSILRYCQAKNLTPEEFNEALELQALRKNDPAAFAQRMQPLFETIQQYTPNAKVTDADLNEALEKSLISLPYAQEIQRSRNVAKGQQQSAQTQQQMWQRQNAVDINSAAATWERSAMAKDPDFKPKVGPNAPDGMYEYAVMRASWLRQAQPPRSSADAVALCERAYADAKSFFAAQRPRPKATPKQLSSSSNATPNGAAPDMAKLKLSDIVNGVANGSITQQHVASWNRRR